MAEKPILVPLSLGKVAGELTVTRNDRYDVRNLASIVVDVPTSGGGGGGSDEDDPIGDERIVEVIKWSAFQTLDKSAIAGRIYSIEL